MTRRILIPLTALFVAAVACTSEPAEPTEPAADLTGEVVILEESGRLSLMSPDGSGRIEIAGATDEIRRFQPIWSPADAVVAWSEEGPEGASIVLADQTGVTSRISSSSFPFYMNWSPDGRLIGALMNGAPGELDFAVYDTNTSEGDVLDSGSPFYFSWSPDSDALVAHVGGESILVYDESGEPTVLGTTRADYLAPVWTESGIIYRNPGGVVIADNIDAGRVLASSQRFLSFTANRAGTLLAVQPLTGAPPEGITVRSGATSEDLPNDVVTVVDVETGESQVVSDGVALGMFWSPDGRKLLMPTIASADGEVELVIWEDRAGARTGATMRLSGDLVGNALQFGDQYAQSWQVWDPDSRAVVFPGTIRDETGIWVVGTDVEPSLISDGIWAAWSSK